MPTGQDLKWLQYDHFFHGFSKTILLLLESRDRGAFLDAVADQEALEMTTLEGATVEGAKDDRRAF